MSSLYIHEKRNEMFPFTKLELSPNEYLENLRTKDCVKIKNDQLILSKNAYRLGDVLPYLYVEEALIHSHIFNKSTPLENSKKVPKNEVRPREWIWKQGEPSIFSCFLSKTIYDMFSPESVFDPCSGWGSRGIGALVSKTVKRYVGVDRNPRLKSSYERLKEELDPKDILEYHICSSLDFETKERFDLVFTSPPFFDYEIYDEDDKYKDHDDWFDNFYVPLLNKCVELAKKYVILHVGNTFRSPRLVQLTKKIMKSLGCVLDRQLFFSSTRDVPVLIFDVVSTPSPGPRNGKKSE